MRLNEQLKRELKELARCFALLAKAEVSSARGGSISSRQLDKLLEATRNTEKLLNDFTNATLFELNMIPNLKVSH